MGKVLSDELAAAYENLLLAAEELKTKSFPHVELNLIRAVDQVHMIKQAPLLIYTPGLRVKRNIDAVVPSHPSEDVGAKVAVIASGIGAGLVAIAGAILLIYL